MAAKAAYLSSFPMIRHDDGSDYFFGQFFPRPIASIYSAKIQFRAPSIEFENHLSSPSTSFADSPFKTNNRTIYLQSSTNSTLVNSIKQGHSYFLIH